MLKKKRNQKNRISNLTLKYLHEAIRKYDRKREFLKDENISRHAFENDLANVINNNGERLSYDLLKNTKVPFAEENWGLNYSCTLDMLIKAGKTAQSNIASTTTYIPNQYPFLHNNESSSSALMTNNTSTPLNSNAHFIQPEQSQYLQKDADHLSSGNNLLLTNSSNNAHFNQTNSSVQPITANITMATGVLSVVSNKPSKISATPYQSGFFNPVQLCSDSTKSPQVAPSHSVSNAIPTHSLSTTEVMQNQQNTNSENISDTYLETDFADDLFSFLENHKDCSDTDSPEDTLSQGSSEKAPFISIPHHNIFLQQFNYTSSSTAIFPLNSSKPSNSTTLNSSSSNGNKRTFTQFNLNDQTEISNDNKKPRI